MGPGHIFDPAAGFNRVLGSSGQPGGGGNGGGDFYTPIPDPNDYLQLNIDGLNNFYFTVNWPDFLNEFYNQVNIESLFPPGVDNDILQLDAATNQWDARNYIAGVLTVGNPVTGDTTSNIQIIYDASGDAVILQPPGVDDNVLSVYQSSGSGQDLRLRLLVDNGSNGGNFLAWDPTGMTQTVDIRKGRLLVTNLPSDGGAHAANVYYDGTQLYTGASGGGGASALSGLSDVALGSLTNGELLSYNSGSGKWTNTSPLGTNNIFTCRASFSATATGTTALSPAIPSGRRLVPLSGNPIAFHTDAVTGSPSTFTIKMGTNVSHDDLRTAAATAAALNTLNGFNNTIGHTATVSLSGTISIEVTVASSATTQTVTVFVQGYLV